MNKTCEIQNESELERGISQCSCIPCESGYIKTMQRIPKRISLKSKYLNYLSYLLTLNILQGMHAQSSRLSFCWQVFFCCCLRCQFCLEIVCCGFKQQRKKQLKLISEIKPLYLNQIFGPTLIDIYQTNRLKIY